MKGTVDTRLLVGLGVCLVLIVLAHVIQTWNVLSVVESSEPGELRVTLTATGEWGKPYHDTNSGQGWFMIPLPEDDVRSVAVPDGAIIVTEGHYVYKKIFNIDGSFSNTIGSRKITLWEKSAEGDSNELWSYENPLGASVNELTTSPDGRFVYFQTSFYESSKDFLVDRITGGELLGGRYNVSHEEPLQWSPDGTFATFRSFYTDYDGSGEDGLFRFDVATLTFTKIGE